MGFVEHSHFLELNISLIKRLHWVADRLEHSQRSLFHLLFKLRVQFHIQRSLGPGRAELKTSVDRTELVFYI